MVETDRKNTFSRVLLRFAFCSLLLTFFSTPAPASESTNDSPGNSSEKSTASSPWSAKWLTEHIDTELGGHIKLRGGVTWPAADSQFSPIGLAPLYDGYANLRLKNRTFITDWVVTEVHYEAILAGGDTRYKGTRLAKKYPFVFPEGLARATNDNNRFFNLTGTISKDDGYDLYHRLDRLSVALTPTSGAVQLFRAGRQAVTWGNGLIFNPMDLFSPFAPTDIERDYKIGEDMLYAQIAMSDFVSQQNPKLASALGGLELVYAPRRDPIKRARTWEVASLAAKQHFSLGETEFDLMAAKQYEDLVFGLGSRGYLGNAAWRLDGTLTFLNERDASRDVFVSLVANVDYSWVWFEKNFYGYVEMYYNSLSDNNYTDSYQRPALGERLERGEFFVLGSTYVAGHVNMELHPLFTVYCTLINNVIDPSGVVQPRAVWNVMQNFEATFGANIYYGAQNTEYGGYKIANTDIYYRPSNNAYCWLTFFF